MTSGPQPFTFELIRPPGRRRSYDSWLLVGADAETMILSHTIQPSKPFHFRAEPVIAAGYTSVWFLFNGKPWDIGRFYRPDGSFTGFYVDVLEPVRWEDASPNTLQPLMDLFLDLWIAPDGAYQVLDEDEFAEAVERAWITPAQTAHARRVLDDLIAETEAGRFPPHLVRDWEATTGDQSHLREGAYGP